jgi:phycoerythrin-associated linker protein
MALWITDDAHTELRPNASEDDLQAVIRSAYRQVFGNAHIMDSERVVNAESLLRNGDITVREFVRLIAQSEQYRSRFFNSSSSYRFVELNFKHLLGRAPVDQAEIAEHVVRYNESGYEAEINSYVDSDEYVSQFGENTVPYYQGSNSQVGIKNVGFNRTFALMRGYASSDTGRSAALIGDVAGNRPTRIKAPTGGSGTYSNTGKRFRVQVSKSGVGPRVNRSVTSFEVGYDQLSQRIQGIQKTGGKILSITEIG